MAVLGQEVVLHVDETAVLVDPFERVASVVVVEAPALRCTVVTEKREPGVVRLGCVAREVKQGIVIKQEVPRVAILRTNDVRSLDGVSTEEDGLPRVSSGADRDQFTKFKPTMP